MMRFVGMYMHGREEKCFQDFGRSNWRSHNFEGIDLSWRIMLKHISRKLVGMYGFDSSG